MFLFSWLNPEGGDCVLSQAGLADPVPKDLATSPS